MIEKKNLTNNNNNENNKLKKTDKAREKFDGWMKSRFIPSFINDLYHSAANRVWGPIVRP